VTATGLAIVVLLLGAAWLLIVRPTRRRQVAMNALLERLEVGDEIVTAGGIYGTIQEIDDDDLLVEIAPDITVRVARRAVAGIVEPELEEDEAEEPGEDEPEAASEPGSATDQR
jgi:preprotein translocase subunit YajC